MLVVHIRLLSLSSNSPARFIVLQLTVCSFLTMGILLAKLWNLFGNEGKDPFHLVLPSPHGLNLQLRIFSFALFSEHKIVLVGLDNAGKTTILYQFLMNEVVQTSPTIGSNVEEVVWKNIHFIMWDLGGQESLRAAWNTYYTNTEVCGCK